MGPWGLFIDGIIHGIVNDYYNDSWLMGVVNHDGITKYYKWDCKSFFLYDWDVNVLILQFFILLPMMIMGL